MYASRFALLAAAAISLSETAAQSCMGGDQSALQVVIVGAINHRLDTRLVSCARCEDYKMLRAYGQQADHSRCASRISLIVLYEYSMSAPRRFYCYG